MESRAAAMVVVSGPEGSKSVTLELSGERVTVGRLPDVNDIALEPDPELLVTREAHCTLEREGAHWFVVDGGSVNGTFLRRRGELGQVTERSALQDGDVVCVLASVEDPEHRRFFELAFQTVGDSQATRPALETMNECLSYDEDEARLVLVSGSERHEIQIRAQAHKLVRYMAERSPALCTHEELMEAIWGDEPMHSREELAKLMWELRKKLEPFGAGHLIENERRLGYRLRTCP
jgi:DNA-binding winged helix-turn-helix (wHTH) protein